MTRCGCSTICRKLEELTKNVEAREAEAWASMTPEKRQAAIGEEVDRQRFAGRADFGNCWSS